MRIDTDRATIRWLHDNKTIRGIQRGGTKNRNVLKLSGDNFRQEGRYTCSFKNSLGKITTSKSFNLHFKGTEISTY